MCYKNEYKINLKFFFSPESQERIKESVLYWALLASSNHNHRLEQRNYIGCLP